MDGSSVGSARGICGVHPETDSLPLQFVVRLPPLLAQDRKTGYQSSRKEHCLMSSAHIALALRRRSSSLKDGCEAETILRLSEFIQSERESILREWEGFARMLMPGLSRFALRDHADVILNVIADDMDHIQSGFQQR